MKKPTAWSGSGGGFSWQFPAPKHQVATVANYLHTTHGSDALDECALVGITVWLALVVIRSCRSLPMLLQLAAARHL